MSVTPQLAERLLPHLHGVALDIVFSASNSFGRSSNAPSSALVRSKWSSLPAASAIDLARVITDTELLDTLSAKEKRKTVRLALVRNTHLHPVTRLYFFQEALRTDDWEMLTEASAKLPHDMLLAMWLEDEKLRRRAIRDRRLLDALMSSDNDELVLRVLEQSELNPFISHMLESDTDRTLALLERLGYDLGSKFAFRDVRVSPDASLESVRTLFRVSPIGYRSVLVRSFLSNHRGDLSFIEGVDPSLLVEAVRERARHSEEDIEVIVRNGLIPTLLASQSRQLPETMANTLMSAPLTPEDAALLALLHPDAEKGAGLIGDPALVVQTSRQRERFDARRWLIEVAPHLDLVTLVALFPMLSDVSGRDLALLARAVNTDIEALLDQLPPEAFNSVSGLPDQVDRHRYLERARALDTSCLRIAAVRLAELDTLCDELLEACLEVLVEIDHVEALGNLLIRVTPEHAARLLPRYRDQFVQVYLHDTRRRHRMEWIGCIINQLTPNTCWGDAYQLAEPSMTYLTERLGDDAETWQTVLGLYEDWCGTLDDLVIAARTL